MSVRYGGYQRKIVRFQPRKRKIEESVQLRVCAYLRNYYPGVIFRSDFSSGLNLTIAQAAKQKRLQSGRSFPDLFIFHPSRGFFGFGLELKKEGTTIVVSRGPQKGHLTADPHIREQVIMLKELKKLGYHADIAVGFEDAKRKIDWYFGRQTADNVELF